jgi:hypothetical protein
MAEVVVDYGMLVLRLLHVGGGILWAGGAVLTTRFVVPTALELGASGAPFMAGLIEKRKLTVYMQIVAGTTVIAGTILYWIAADGDIIGWLTGGGRGTVLGIGAIAAWLAFLEGILQTGPAAKKLGALGAEAAAAGGPPSDDLKARMGKAQATMRRSGTITFYLLLVAIATMATARYFG